MGPRERSAFRPAPGSGGTCPSTGSVRTRRLAFCLRWSPTSLKPPNSSSKCPRKLTRDTVLKSSGRGRGAFRQLTRALGAQRASETSPRKRFQPLRTTFEHPPLLLSMATVWTDESEPSLADEPSVRSNDETRDSVGALRHPSLPIATPSKR